MSDLNLPESGDGHRFCVLADAHWSDGPETLVVVRAKDVRLGGQTYTGDRLRAAIAEAVAEVMRK